MERLKVPVCACAALLAGACGPASVDDRHDLSSAPPAIMHELSSQPGCYTALEQPLDQVSGPAWDQMDLLRQIVEMQTSFQIQYTDLLLRPVREEPTAREWRDEGEYQTIEGRSFARGRGWGHLALSMNMHAQGEVTSEYTLSAEVHYNPAWTAVDFSAVELVAGDNFLKRDDYVWGCDPDTGISFKIGPALVEDEVIEDAITCWGGDLDQPQDNPPGGSHAQCLDAVNHVMTVYALVPPWFGEIPVVVVP